jgi:chromosome segregation ATPase
MKIEAIMASDEVKNRITKIQEDITKLLVNQGEIATELKTSMQILKEHSSALNGEKGLVTEVQILKKEMCEHKANHKWWVTVSISATGLIISVVLFGEKIISWIKRV